MYQSNRQLIRWLICLAAAGLFAARSATATPVVPFALGQAITASREIVLARLVGLVTTPEGRVAKLQVIQTLRGDAPAKLNVAVGTKLVAQGSIGNNVIAFLGGPENALRVVSDLIGLVPASRVPSGRGTLADRISAAIAARLNDRGASPPERSLALLALASADTPANRVSLRRLAVEPHTRLGHAALCDLLAWGDSFALPQAVGALLHPENESTESLNGISASLALGRWPAIAIPQLERLQASGAVNVRLAAATALARTNSAAAMPGLGAALDDADEGIRYQAVWGLRVISGAGPISMIGFREHEAELIAEWKSKLGRK